MISFLVRNPLILLLCSFLLFSCKGRVEKQVIKKSLEAPSEVIVLSVRAGDSGNNSEPEVLVKGVRVGALVKVYSDSACRFELGKKFAESSNAIIKLANLGLDKRFDFYANQLLEGEVSPCSSSRGIYNLDTVAPDPVSRVELIDPPFPFGDNPFPEVEIGDNLNIGGQVILYEDTECIKVANTIDITEASLRQKEPFTAVRLRPNEELANGLYRFSAIQVDPAGNLSRCSGPLVYAEYDLDKIPLDAPNNIGVVNTEDPAGEYLRVDTDQRPLVRVLGMENGNIARIFLDELCEGEELVSSAPARFNGVEVRLTSEISPDGEFTFYARQQRPNGQLSDCSADPGLYRLDTQVVAPSDVTLLNPNPESALRNSVTNAYVSSNNTPTILVKGVEPRALVQLFSDSSCVSELSDQVRVDQEASEVAIETYELDEGFYYEVYARQIDEVGHISDCSALYIPYEFNLDRFNITLDSHYEYDIIDPVELGTSFKIGGRCSDNGQQVGVTGSITTSVLCDNGFWEAIVDMSNYDYSLSGRYLKFRVTHPFGASNPATQDSELFVSGNGLGRTGIGSIHMCHVRAGRLKCWGTSNAGQLGLGTVSTVGDFPGQMVRMANEDINVNLGNFNLGGFGLGYDYTCAYGSGAENIDRGIKCWGRNDGGQLGQGDTSDRGDNINEMGDKLEAFYPALSANGDTLRVIKVEGGENHVCGLFEFSDGRRAVKCWGYNNVGQLGIGNTASQGDDPNDRLGNQEFVDFGVGLNVIDIAVGGNHNCAVLDDTTDFLEIFQIKCWGHNTWGQLGYGDKNHRGDVEGEMGDALPFVDLGSLRSVQKVTAGHRHTCALFTNGTVKCWGHGDHGAIGPPNGNTIGARANNDHEGDAAGEMGDALYELEFYDFPSQVAVVDLFSGGYHNCAIFDNGAVKCWGLNSRGQLGQGITTYEIGDNTDEMGNSLRVSRLPATPVDLSLGLYHSCALFEDKSVRCWGLGSSGQLGQDSGSDIGRSYSSMDNLSPIYFGQQVVGLKANGYHTCVSFTNEKIRCFGSDTFSQLGLGNNSTLGEDKDEMGGNLPYVRFKENRIVQAVAAAYDNTCAVLLDTVSEEQHLKCWGSNGADLLAINAPHAMGVTPATIPEFIDDIYTVGIVDREPSDRIMDLAISENHICGVWTDGEVHCWGLGNTGRLGRGSSTHIGDAPTDKTIPVNLGTVSGRSAKAHQVCVGSEHTCALIEDGTVKCWGRNSEGQLGQDDTTIRGTSASHMGDNLLPINLGLPAKQISCYGENSCALLTDGNVKCWGRRSRSCQGNDPTAQGNYGSGPLNSMANLEPINFGVNSAAVSIKGGIYHACAIFENYEVRCWGHGEFGRLGNGNASATDRGDADSELGALITANVTTPITSIFLGSNNSCSYHRPDVDRQGGLKCWGRGINGVNGQESPAQLDTLNELADNLPFIIYDEGDRQ